uniref:Uncharacterized protein n=1 Tax=Anguilla anguilla TaxID=7936 RepID=A0A0E9T152_ANGAN
MHYEIITQEYSKIANDAVIELATFHILHEIWSCVRKLTIYTTNFLIFRCTGNLI